MSRQARLAVVTVLLAGPGAFAADVPPSPFLAQGALQAVFAPWDDIESAVIEVIESARKQVLVQAYLFTNKRIAAALVAAHRSGIEVSVLVDAVQLEKVKPHVVHQLVADGIPVWLENRYQNAHNKIMVVDAGTPDATVITGSFNFTWTAQHKNAENILIARSNPVLAARYAQNWERHRQDATPLKR